MCGWKIVRVWKDKYYSWFIGDNPHRVEYIVDIYSTPHKGDGPLCVWDNEDLANNFLELAKATNEQVVKFKCKYIPSSFTKVWVCGEDKVSSDVRDGTILADKVMILLEKENNQMNNWICIYIESEKEAEEDVSFFLGVHKVLEDETPKERAHKVFSSFDPYEESQYYNEEESPLKDVEFFFIEDYFAERFVKVNNQSNNDVCDYIANYYLLDVCKQFKVQKGDN